MNSLKKLFFFLTALSMVAMACGFGTLDEVPDAPTVVINSPANDSIFQVGETITITTSATAAAGIARIELSAAGSVVSELEVAGSPQSYGASQTWVPQASGQVALSVVAYDSNDLASEPSMVIIEVQGADAPVLPSNTPVPLNSPLPPTATFPPTNTFTPIPPTWTSSPVPPTATFTATDEPIQLGTLQIIVTFIPIFIPYVELESSLVSVPPGEIAYTTATCPSGSVVVGGGFSEGDGFVYNTSQNGNGWRTYTRGGSGTHNLIVYAVCLYYSGGTTSQVYDQVTVPANSELDMDVQCPAGTTATGGGWAGSSNGEVEIVYSAVYSNGWRITAINSSGSGRLVNVYATCLAGRDASVTANFQIGSVSAHSENYSTATCLNANQLVSSGGFSHNDDTDVVYTHPLIANDQWRVGIFNPNGADRLFSTFVTCLTLE